MLWASETECALYVHSLSANLQTIHKIASRIYIVYIVMGLMYGPCNCPLCSRTHARALGCQRHTANHP